MARAQTRKYAFDFHEGFSPNTGTFIDGTFGEGHAVEVMAGLLARVLRVTNDKEARALLDEQEADDIGEENVQEWLDDATEVLEDNTAPGLVWEWEAGDLVLREEGQDDA